jgi:uncharacterized membrane protein YqjE
LIQTTHFYQFSLEKSAMFETIRKSKEISVIAKDRLGDYFELLRIEMKLQGKELGLMALSGAVGAMFALITVIFIGLAIIVTFWGSEYRTLVAWLVVALYAVIAGAGFAIAMKHKPSNSAFSTLRNEVRRDVELVKENI